MTRRAPVHVNSDSVFSSPYHIWALPFPLSGTEETGPLKNAGIIAVHPGPGTWDQLALHSMPVGAAHFLQSMNLH